MIESEKKEFVAVINKTSDLYDKKIELSRVSVYWDALRHRSIDDIKTAINRHIQDPQRGRFFPLPADITAQLPDESTAWLTADEAWALVPKSENDSAAMCDEMAQALYIAQDLIDGGDTIAARRAFIDHYNRQIEIAKRENRKPKWWASLGTNPESRHRAEVEVVNLKNLLLPPSQHFKLPAPLEHYDFQNLTQQIQERDKELATNNIEKLKSILGKSNFK